MIRAVVFDVGDVVCAFAPERRLQELALRTGLEPEHIHDVIWTSGLDRRAEAGELTPAETEALLLDALDRRVDAGEMRAAWSSAFVPDSRVCDVIAGLACPVFAFTNNGPMLGECLAHELIAVGRLFQRVICSWQVRARKPDPIAFERLCSELRRQPEELLFVDDSAANVESARSIGMFAITFASVERLAEDLERTGRTGQ